MSDEPTAGDTGTAQHRGQQSQPAPAADVLTKVMAELGVTDPAAVLPALERRFTALVNARKARDLMAQQKGDAEQQRDKLRAEVDRLTTSLDSQINAKDSAYAALENIKDVVTRSLCQLLGVRSNADIMPAVERRYAAVAATLERIAMAAMNARSARSRLTGDDHQRTLDPVAPLDGALEQLDLARAALLQAGQVILALPGEPRRTATLTGRRTGHQWVGTLVNGGRWRDEHTGVVRDWIGVLEREGAVTVDPAAVTGHPDPEPEYLTARLHQIAVKEWPATPLPPLRTVEDNELSPIWKPVAAPPSDQPAPAGETVDRLRINGHLVTAAALAEAQVQIARTAGRRGYGWDDLDDFERARLTRNAGWALNALATLLPPALDPHNGKPVFGPPQLLLQEKITDMIGDPDVTEPDSAGWDLSGGARINYGRVDDGGDLLVTLNIGDYALLAGIVQRIVTEEQLIAHAQHLLHIAGGRYVVAQILPTAAEGNPDA